MTTKRHIVSIQGETGSFHHIAARHFFGGQLEILARDSFAGVFSDLQQAKADFAVVAVENSLAGSINEVYDLLREDGQKIIGEVYMRISLNLIGQPDAKISDVRQIYSHPVALMEAEQYLANLSGVDVHERHDTAGSVAYIAKSKDKSLAAISSKESAKLYGMKVLAADIETDKQNHTRFVLLVPRGCKNPDGANKSSIIITTNHQPGALYNALGVFAKRNINLSKLESRPIIGKGWHYYFYLDFDAGLDEHRSKQALSELKDYTGEINILGTYIKGKVIDQA
ncbi:prephenate dehydratase [Candidatus Saccharibacteria bacterium]|nr:prephenate dehydratase [Candidatus Saccharibacteria bacterium]